MDLLEYISDQNARKQLAEDVFTSPEYLWQIASRWRGKRASARLADAIERATNGAVTRYELREDVFGAAPESPKAGEAA